MSHDELLWLANGFGLFYLVGLSLIVVIYVYWPSNKKKFEQAAAKYRDVKLPGGDTVSKRANAELFGIRNLSVGKNAPDIEGQDQDGKRFKLSDYRGKVVLLDFWSYV